jgi:hypothetical protein
MSTDNRSSFATVTHRPTPEAAVGGRRLVLELPPDAGAEVHGPRPRPYDLVGWTAALVGDAPGERLETELGWPVVLHESADALVAIYELLDFVAAVVVHGGDRGRARAALLAARPELHGDEIVALVELWETP